MDRVQPVERPLHEGGRRHQHRHGAEIQRLHHAHHQTHVVVQRHPTYAGRTARVLLIAVRIISRFASRLSCATMTPLGVDVEPDVYCRNATSSRSADRQAGSGIVRRIIHRADGHPVKAGIAKALGDVGTAFEKFVCGHRDLGRAVGDDGRAGIAGGGASRHHQRHRDHARGETAEERHDEIQSGREHEHRAVTSDSATREARRDGAGAPVQFGECQVYMRAAALRHEHEGLRVGPFGCAPGEQIDQRCRRGAEIELAQATLPACRCGARLDLEPARDEAGQLRDGGMLHGSVGREFQSQPVLDGGDKEHRLGRVQPKAGELRVHVDGDIGQLQCSCADRRRTTPGYPVRSRRVTVVAWLLRCVTASLQGARAFSCDPTAVRGASSTAAVPVPPDAAER